MGLCDDCRSKCDTATAAPAPVFGFGEEASSDGYVPELASHATVTASHTIVPFRPVHAPPAPTPAPGPLPVMEATFREEVGVYQNRRITIEAALINAVLAVAVSLFIFHLGTTQKT
jgi:hypothetical protein